MNKPQKMQNLFIRMKVILCAGQFLRFKKEMGSGFLEAVYQECLSKEFTSQQIPFQARAQLSLSYKGELLKQIYIPDFICYNKIIIEIKGVKKLAPEYRAQLLNYLRQQV